MNDFRIAFIGAGVMAETMIAGMRADGIGAERILASHRREHRALELKERYGIRVVLDNAEAAAWADLVVLATKPQSLPHVLPALRGRLREDAVLLSIVAGARTSVLRDALDHPRVVRSMPNLPCRIRRGMTVWYAAPTLGQTDLDRVRAVLQVMGEEARVEDEAHVDRATAVSGTGPAVVAHFVKAYLEAAAYIGEPRGLARASVLATLEGTVAMLRQSEDHVAELIDEVTSPGGTTSRALQVLKNGRFSAVLTEAIEAAYARSTELGEQIARGCREPNP
ncbi:MAG: pyrroline-5-carboxylate reductase [Pseudomonadota bacterium]|nr:pyrroline-5-carboxylate reductase [Pseudomonadota bacterium]